LYTEKALSNTIFPTKLLLEKMSKRKELKTNYLIFLGTGGARVVVFKQILASGGMWLSLEGTNLYLDPGPGALVKCRNKKLDPTKLHGILLSHKHLDHSADINVMIEAMTEGGFKPRGVVFAPRDALDKDPVIFQYLRNYVAEIISLEEGKFYSFGKIKLQTPIRHIHGVETYGVNFYTSRFTFSYIADTRYFPEITDHYRGDILLLNIVRLEPSNLDHLSLADAKKIIASVKPKGAILSHFGMTVLRAKPFLLAQQLTQELGIKIIAAQDGMQLDLEEITG